MEARAFSYYMHDGPTGFTIELAGTLDPKGAKTVEQDWPSDDAVVGKTQRLLDLTFVTQIDPEERRLLRHWLENVPNIDFNHPVRLELRSHNARCRVYIDARGLWMPARLTSVKSVEDVRRGEAA
ncbi:MAG: hypothetical protein ABSH32_20180 [Bryobacteraceae bacterium]|jgi:hypothetical protein